MCKRRKKNINNYYMLNIHDLIIIGIYIFFIYSVFSTNIIIIRASIYLGIFMLLKWIFNYRKCTFGYLECKIRKVEREKGFINNFCKYYGDLIYTEYKYYLFVILIIIYLINLIKLILYFRKSYMYI